LSLREIDIMIAIMKERPVDTAKVFTTGRSQAVRLPKEFRFDVKEVRIRRIGDLVVLYPPGKEFDILKASLEMFPPDFMADGRRQPKRADRRKW
jgi:antitoxin VapB